VGSVPCYFVFAGNTIIDGHRVVGVLINADDGTEANLQTLLDEFSRQYPEPEYVEIRLYANLKQANDFAWLVLGDRLAPRTPGYFAAAIFRDSGNELIRYRPANGKIVTVVVRGRDIFPDL